MVQRPPAGTIPDAPGSYQFKDRDGRVIYVGKAKSLRSRLSNYFVKASSLPPRTASMVAAAETVEWIQVRNDVEALMLENTLIKSHQPRFNVRLRDDKSYPFLAVTMDDEWPRPMVMRGRKRKGVRTSGPTATPTPSGRPSTSSCAPSRCARARTTSSTSTSASGGRASSSTSRSAPGPCVGEVSKEEYDQHVEALLQFLDGDTDSVVQELETRMHEAAGELEFEQAARLRDRLTSVQKAIEKQQMVAERSEDFDVLGIADDELEAAVQVFFVRKGRVVGRKGFIVDKVEDLTPGGAREQRGGAPLRRPAAGHPEDGVRAGRRRRSRRSTRSGSSSIRGSKVVGARAPARARSASSRRR